MSEADVELVRTIYERFRANDVDGALALQHPDIEVHDRPETPDPQVYRGHQGMIESVSASQATFAALDIEPEEFIDAGEGVVVVVFRFRGTGRESGIPVEDRLAHRWTIRDGKAARMSVHSSSQAALE